MHVPVIAAVFGHRVVPAPANLGIGGTALEIVLAQTGLASFDILRGQPLHELNRILKRIPDIRTRDPSQRNRLAAVAYAALLELAAMVGSTHSPAVREALAFVKQNQARDVTLARIAAAAGMSVSRLARRFRQEVGEPPLRCHAARRMEQAAALLSHTAASVKSVAHRLGFADPLYFSKRFSKHMGVSPRQWRTRNGQGRGERPTDSV